MQKGINIKNILSSVVNSSKKLFDSDNNLPSVRISEVFEKNNKKYFVIQFHGRNLFRKFTAKEVLSNSSILGSLSENDATAVISEIYKNEKDKFRYTLNSIDKPDNADATLFCYYDNDTNTHYRKTSSEIVKLENADTCFNPKDWYLIARTNGIEFAEDQDRRLQEAIAKKCD